MLSTHSKGCMLRQWHMRSTAKRWGSHPLAVGLDDRQAQGRDPLDAVPVRGHHLGAARQPLHDVRSVRELLPQALQRDLRTSKATYACRYS